MNGPEASLRPARPDPADGRAYAAYLDAAAEGFFRFWLGPEFAVTIAEAYTKPDHDLSYEHATFAVRGDRVVGMASCFTHEQHRRSTRGPLKESAGYRPVRSALIAGAFFPMMRILDRLEAGDFYLQAIAVDENSRGQGIGSILLNLVEERARTAGCSRICLDVSAGNVGARRLYERWGMTVVKASPKLFFAPRFRLLRMARAV